MGITTKHDLFHDVTIIGHRDSKLQADGRLLYGELSDPTLIRLRTMFSEAYGFDAGANNIYDAVRALAFENCFDPILDLCDEAQRQWEREGVERLDAFAVEYLKAEDTELNRAIIRKHLIASVRTEQPEPGCRGGGNYPNLATVPPPPTRAMTATEREKLTQSLVADRANARYSNEQLRAGFTAASAAPPPPPAAPGTSRPPSLPARPRPPRAGRTYGFHGHRTRRSGHRPSQAHAPACGCPRAGGCTCGRGRRA